MPSAHEKIATNELPQEMKILVRQHINSFPAMDSHYSRKRSAKTYLHPNLNINIMYNLYKEWCHTKLIPDEKVVKESMYRNIFHNDFNFSFKPPKNDTCDICDQPENTIKNSLDEAERNRFLQEKESHLADGDQRYEMKKEDKLRSRNKNSKERTVMIDLEKCLPTPLLLNGKTFYLRSLWTFNLTIYDSTKNAAHCLVWDETIAHRGGNEIASCIMQLLMFVPEDVEEITIWSDNCAGQNKNAMLFSMYTWILFFYSSIKVINHKYLLTGHTHMEADSIHALIEKKKKRLPTMSIQTSREWAQFMRTCGTHIQVHEMKQTDFKNWSLLYNKSFKSPLIQRKSNTDGEPFLSSSIVYLQVRKEELGIIRYKTSFTQADFMKVSFKRNIRKNLEFSNDVIKPLNGENELLPINKAKYDNLMVQMQWIDPHNQEFYKRIPIIRDRVDSDEDCN